MNKVDKDDRGKKGFRLTTVLFFLVALTPLTIFILGMVNEKYDTPVIQGTGKFILSIVFLRVCFLEYKRDNKFAFYVFLINTVLWIYQAFDELNVF